MLSKDKTHRRITVNKNKTLARVTLLFFGFVFVYILQSIIVFAVKPHIAVDHIAPGSVIAPVDLSGVIIRDEKIYKCPDEAAGSVRYSVAGNERVKKDETVCNIENTDEVSRINAELADVNAELLKVRDIRTNAPVNENEQRVNVLMKNMLDNWAGRMNTDDFSTIYTLKDSIAANVDVRNQLILSDSSGALKEQANKRQMYQDELNKNMTPVKSEGSGVVSILLDGYEDTYTLNITAMLQKEQTMQKGVRAAPAPPQTAQKGTPLFKIVRSNIWYIASYLPNDLIKGWQANEAKVIYLDNFPGLPVTVDHITQKGSESYVLFKCTRYMEDFLTSRFIHFKVGSDSSDGLKIPQTAVVSKTLLYIPREYVSIEDDQMKTAKITKSNGDKITFNYMAADGDMVYVDPANGVIAQGMEVKSLTHPQAAIKLTETAEITGVFRVNNGAADFRKIILDTSTQDEGYYLLNPDSNKNLQENDSVVRYAAKVNEGDIIY